MAEDDINEALEGEIPPTVASQDEITDRECSSLRDSEIEKEVEDEHYDEIKSKIEILIELGAEELRPLTLSSCYASDRPGMHLEIFPKIIFDTAEFDLSEDEINLPKSIFRQTTDQSTLASVEFVSSKAQTTKNKLLNSWSQYEPRLFSKAETASIQQKSSYKTYLPSAEKRIKSALIQNTIADHFLRDIGSLYDDKSDLQQDKSSSFLLNGSFSCFENDQQRMIKSIDWHPLIKDIFLASTMSRLRYEEKIHNSINVHDDATRFYIWSAKNQFYYKLLLEYHDDIAIFKFNSVMPNLIAGGSITGQLILWDLQNVKIASNEKEMNDGNFEPIIVRYTAASSMDYCHIHGLTDLMWIPNHIEVLAKGHCKQNGFNHSYQIATCGLDGVLRFWDLRAAIAHKPGQTVPKYFHNLDGKWEPFHSVDIMSSDGKRQSVTCFTLREVSKMNEKGIKEVSQDNDPGVTNMDNSANKPLSTEFICGCDDGKLLHGNFKLEKDETGKYITKFPELFASPHSSSVTTLTPSPFVEDVFLSGGSRTFAIWKHEIQNPILLREMHTNITSGEWSPTKPSVFIVGYDDGSIEVWNLLSNIYEPYLVYFVSTSAVNSISFQTLSENEQIVAIGDAKGVVYILTVPHYLWKSAHNELELTIHYINEEADRIQNLSYEEKMPTEKPEETLIQQKEKAKPPEDIPREIAEEELLLKNYEEFQELEKIHLRYLGLIEDDDEENEDK